jgi:hypothetical protein
MPVSPALGHLRYWDMPSPPGAALVMLTSMDCASPSALQSASREAEC